MNHKFTGTGVALVTPFEQDLSVDYQSLRRIVTHVMENGAEYVVALGTTSESPVLTPDEKLKVVDVIMETVNGKLPVVMGIGGNNTTALIKQIQQYRFQGIAGILSVAPYYNKPQQGGLYEHFRTIAEASPVPVILYNVPGRTSSNLGAVTTLKLAHDCANIVAIKEASGNMEQIMQIIAGKPENFEVLSGDDALTLPMMALGAKGVISVTANGCTRDFTDMVRFMLDHDLNNALPLHYKLLPMMEALFADGNPAGIKALLHRMGLCKNVLRLPLVKANEEVQLQIASHYHNMNP